MSRFVFLVLSMMCIAALADHCKERRLRHDPDQEGLRGVAVARGGTTVVHRGPTVVAKKGYGVHPHPRPVHRVLVDADRDGDIDYVVKERVPSRLPKKTMLVDADRDGDIDYVVKQSSPSRARKMPAERVIVEEVPRSQKCCVYPLLATESLYYAC